MTPNEFKAALQRLEMGPDEIAEALGMHSSSIYRYLKGTRAIPRPMELAVGNIEKLRAYGAKPVKEYQQVAFFTSTAETTEARFKTLDAYCAKLERAQYDLVARAEKAEWRARGLLKIIREAAGALLIEGNAGKARDILLGALDEDAPQP